GVDQRRPRSLDRLARRSFVAGRRGRLAELLTVLLEVQWHRSFFQRRGCDASQRLERFRGRRVFQQPLVIGRIIIRRIRRWRVRRRWRIGWWRRISRRRWVGRDVRRRQRRGRRHRRDGNRRRGCRLRRDRRLRDRRDRGRRDENLRDRRIQE